jgi:hypothetical protein
MHTSVKAFGDFAIIDFAACKLMRDLGDQCLPIMETKPMLRE